MAKNNNYNMPPSGKKDKNEAEKTQNNSVQNNETNKSSLNSDEIKKLPLRSIITMGKEFFGHYDEENLVIYFVDKNGALTGQRGRLKKPLLPEKPIEDEDEKTEEGSSNSTHELVKDAIERTYNEKKKEAIAILDDKLNNKKNKANKEPKPKKKWKRFLIIVIILIVCGFGVFFGVKYAMENFLDNVVNDVTQTPKEGEIMVIEVKNDIIPGEEIRENNLKAANIDSQTYNQISINGNDLYRWEQKDNIVGMYATEYISQGHYVTANAVTKIYKEDTNPWEVEDNELTVSVDIPIDINDYDRTSLIMGKKVNIRYQIDQKESNSSETLTSDMPGITATQEEKTIITKMYYIENAVISNVIAGNDKELFNTYSSLMKIPEGNQEHYIKQSAKYNKEYISSITPTKIRVVLDADYAKELKRAISNNYSIEIELLDDVDISNANKQAYYEKEVQLMNNFASVLK